jgi:hypothetical protein
MKSDSIDIRKTGRVYSSLESAVLAKLQEIEWHGYEIRAVRFDELKKQNIFSSRGGARLCLRIEGEGHTQCENLWVKQVENPRAVYEAMSDVFYCLAAAGVEGPVPKPILYEDDFHIVVMEEVIGSSLLKNTIQNLIGRKRGKLDKTYSLYADIGTWLRKFHDLTWTSKYLFFEEEFALVMNRVETSHLWSDLEKKRIIEKLLSLRTQNLLGGKFRLVRLHNDFTLRNILVDERGVFSVIDWDAMVHPKFEREGWLYSDLATLLINIQSLTRFSPLVRRSHVEVLIENIVRGYFGVEKCTSRQAKMKEIDGALYVQALKFFLSMGCDRPLDKIYKDRLGWRYVSKLKRNMATQDKYKIF